MLEGKITFDKFIKGALAVALLLAVLLATNYLSGVLLPFFAAWLLAYLLNPVVNFVQNKMRVKVRALAIVFTMLVLFIVIGGILYLIIPPMIDQFKMLGSVIDKYVQQTTHSNSLTQMIGEWLKSHQKDIDTLLNSKDFQEAVKQVMPNFFSVLGQTANVVLSVIASLITLIYMFFILLDYEYLTNNWVKIFPKKNRPFWLELMADVERVLNNYIRGQSMVALCMGVMFCIGLTIIDFPVAIGLGILIGVLTLVPYLHSLAFIPIIFLSLLKAADTGENFWVVFGGACLVFAIIQISFEAFITPKIMSQAMNLNPAILLLSLSVWGALLGFIGLIIALPLTTLIIAYWQRYVTKEHDLQETDEKSKE